MDQILFDSLTEYCTNNGLDSFSFSLTGIDALLAEINQRLSAHRAEEALSGDYWFRNGQSIWYVPVTVTVDGEPVVLSQDPRGELALITEIKRV